MAFCKIKLRYIIFRFIASIIVMAEKTNEIKKSILLPYEASVKRAVLEATDGQRHTEKEKRSAKRVRRRLTVAGPRGARGEEGGTEETGCGGARHQAGAVLRQQ